LKQPSRAKYQLQHVLRTNLAANDAAYNCVYETEDEEGHRGVRLSKDLMAIAGGPAGSRGEAVGKPWGSRPKPGGESAQRRGTLTLFTSLTTTPPTLNSTLIYCPPPTPSPGESLKANITTLGPLVLPVSEQLLFAANFVARKVGRGGAFGGGLSGLGVLRGEALGGALRGV
jgi:hypothetical protein